MKKKKLYKSEKLKVSQDINVLSSKINDLYEKVSESDYANKVYELKINDLKRINDDVSKKLDYLKDNVKMKKLGEDKILEELNKSKDEIQKLKEELKEKEDLKLQIE